jgi:hypothetical protein
MNGSSPFLNLCFTKGSKQDLNRTKCGISVFFSSVQRQTVLSKATEATQLAIYHVSNHDVAPVFLTLHTRVGPIVLRLLCFRGYRSTSWQLDAHLEEMAGGERERV